MSTEEPLDLFKEAFGEGVDNKALADYLDIAFSDKVNTEFSSDGLDSLKDAITEADPILIDQSMADGALDSIMAEAKIILRTKDEKNRNDAIMAFVTNLESIYPAKE